MSFQNPITGGQGALIRPAIKSPNFTEGVSGWSIDRNGNAEFNNGTFRGTVTASTFEGTDYMINSAGAFFYSGPPAAGNLIASIAPTAGTDAFGNAYQAGLSSYEFGNILNMFDSRLTGGSSQTSQLQLQDGNFSLASGGTGTDTNQVNLLGESATAAGTPFVTFASTAPGSSADILVTGAVLKAATATVPYTWQAPGYNADWSGATMFNGESGFHALQYRLDAQDNLVMEGAFTAALGAAGTVFTLPAGPYRPQMSGLLPCLRLISATSVVTTGMLRVDANGNVVVSTANGLGVATGDQFYCSGTGGIALGNAS
jgi:hypothetical protein